MRVLVTGGCGYKGSVLVPKLLAAGHEVHVMDMMWFGIGNDYDPMPINLTFERRDMRNAQSFDLSGFDAVIHLAGIANDPCGELDARLTWEVNVLGTLFLAQAAERAGVRRFIFASSASVYGIKGGKPVTEFDEMTPVSDYNKTKMCAEAVLQSFMDRMVIQIIRPATICGMSPRMRLDTVVNMLTMQALTKGRITAHCGAHGGALMRPNTHIEDITDLYCWLLEHQPHHCVYNAGFENLSVMETAELIAKAVPGCELEMTEVQDKRSYCVDSTQLMETGFRPKHSVEEAIRDIVSAYRGGFRETPMMTNLTWMRSQGLVRDVR